MNRRSIIAGVLFAVVSLAPFGKHVIADDQPLFGYSAESSRVERQWEEKLRAIPSPENLRSYMEHLSAHPQLIFKLSGFKAEYGRCQCVEEDG